MAKEWVYCNTLCKFQIKLLIFSWFRIIFIIIVILFTVILNNYFLTIWNDSSLCDTRYRKYNVWFLFSHKDFQFSNKSQVWFRKLQVKIAKLEKLKLRLNYIIRERERERNRQSAFIESELIISTRNITQSLLYFNL